MTSPLTSLSALPTISFLHTPTLPHLYVQPTQPIGRISCWLCLAPYTAQLSYSGSFIACSQPASLQETQSSAGTNTIPWGTSKKGAGALHMQQCAALSASIFSPSASYMHFLKEGLSYTVGSCQRKELIPQNCEGEGDCWNHLAGVMKGVCCTFLSLSSSLGCTL